SRAPAPGTETATSLKDRRASSPDISSGRAPNRPTAGGRREQVLPCWNVEREMDRRARLIRDGYVEYLRSRNFDPYFRKLHRPPRWRYVFAVPMILSVVGVGVGLGLIASAWISSRKTQRIRQDMIEAAQRSVPIMTYPIMVNVALLRQK